MKKIFFPALVALALALAPTAANAQIVNDPLHMGIHIGDFAKRLKQWTETVQNYQVVKDARQIAGYTKDLTSQGLELQRQIQTDLRKVQSVRDLALANPQQLFVNALAMAGRNQTNNYLPVFAKAARLRQALQLNNQTRDVGTIYDVFSRTNDGAPMDANTYQARREESAVSTYAYEQMARKRKIDTAVSFYKIADEMTKQSVELNATLKNPGRYSMTEGERMAAMNMSNDNLIKAMQLRLDADRLIGETTQSSPVQAATEATYADVLLQSELLKYDAQRHARRN